MGPLWLALALVCQAPAPVAPGAPEALWDAGRRLDAIDALAAVVAADEATRDGELERQRRARLAGWQLAVHRYEAALASASLLGPELDALRGLALYRLGRFADALVHLDPRARDLCLLRVDALEALGRFEESDQALAQAERTLGGDDPELLVFAGRARARAGAHDEAAALFARALERDPTSAPALFGRGRALLQSGRRDEGLACLERHRRLLPLVDRRDFARKSLDLAPLHAANHAEIGDVERELAHVAEAPARLALAAAAYARAEALAQGAELVPVALRRARLEHEDLGDLEQALATLARASARHADARLLVRAGDLLLGAGRAGEALARFERAAELRPDDEAVAARLAAARAALAREGER